VYRLLTPRGEPAGGRLAFQCRVSEQREWRIQMSKLSLTLDPEAYEALTLDGTIIRILGTDNGYRN